MRFESASDQANWYAFEARSLAVALSESLPQATFHRLVAILIEMLAGHYCGVTRLYDKGIHLDSEGDEQ